jgi:hypothetical protein
VKVTYKTASGFVATPVYEPAVGRLEHLMKFYKEQFHSFQIEAYKIENAWGVVVAQEGQL